MKMKSFVALLCFLGSAMCHGGTMEISARMVSGGEHLFVLRDTRSKEKSGWLTLGEPWHGHMIRRLAPGSQEVEIVPDPKGYRERLITMRASPQTGFSSKPRERLVLVAGSSVYRMDWSVGFIHNAPVLLPGQDYDFVLVERSHRRGNGNSVWHDVYRITQGNRVLYDCRVCEVHGGPLESKFIPTRHGYSGLPDAAKLEARTHKFPHAESGRTSTCMSVDDEPAMTEIWICRPCETAYQEWTKGRANEASPQTMNRS